MMLSNISNILLFLTNIFFRHNQSTTMGFQWKIIVTSNRKREQRLNDHHL